MASLLDLAQARLGGLLDIPTRAARALVNPTAFSGLLGAPTLPQQQGFAESFAQLPQQPNMSVLDPMQASYMQGYSAGEPYGLLAALAPFTKGMPVGASIKDVSNVYKFQDIVDNLNNKGLVVDAYESAKRPIITLSRIEVPKESRNKGIGTDAMQDLTSYADETDKIIALSPSKDFGASSVSRLKEFYKKFDFVENKGKNKDFSISETMYRKPKKETVVE
jgi:GNAT superfamily N-acetyltransferase